MVVSLCVSQVCHPPGVRGTRLVLAVGAQVQEYGEQGCGSTSTCAEAHAVSAACEGVVWPIPPTRGESEHTDNWAQ